VSVSVFRIHLLASYFKLMVLLPPPLYYNNSTGFQSKKITSNYQPSPTISWPLDLQLICLPYLHRTILPVLFVPLIRCFFSVSQLNVILVPVPFVLLLLLFGTRYLILSELLVLYFPLNVLSKLTISSLPFTHPSTSARTSASDCILDIGAS